MSRFRLGGLSNITEVVDTNLSPRPKWFVSLLKCYPCTKETDHNIYYKSDGKTMICPSCGKERKV